MNAQNDKTKKEDEAKDNLKSQCKKTSVFCCSKEMKYGIAAVALLVVLVAITIIILRRRSD